MNAKASAANMITAPRSSLGSVASAPNAPAPTDGIDKLRNSMLLGLGCNARTV